MYSKLLNCTDMWELYKALAGGNNPSFFLDSSLYDPDLGRYSFIGWEPRAVLRSRGQEIEYWANGQVEKWQGDPLQALERVRQEGQSRIENPNNWPFCGGLVGYISYDMKNYLEKVNNTVIDDLKMYDQYWGVYDRFLCMDHTREELWMVSLDAGGLKEMEADINEKMTAVSLIDLAPARVGELQSNFQPEDYIQAIKKVHEYIRQGDIYQVNLSQRFHFLLTGSHKSFYEIFRKVSPSCFGAFLHFEEYDLMSISPERFLRVTGREIETRPIKGTRSRGKTPAEDEQLKRELRESEKEQAELLMIVDMERNDLGKICATGSIGVEDLYKVSSYTTIFHMDARVHGKLKPEAGISEIIRATFPGGSITGAPKIMAMNIIDKLEPHARGVYTGSIGYIDYLDNCDLNIAIRTVIARGEDAYYQAGGGLVADSNPEMEYEETWTKTRALLLTGEELDRIAGEKD